MNRRLAGMLVFTAAIGPVAACSSSNGGATGSENDGSSEEDSGTKSDSGSEKDGSSPKMDTGAKTDSGSEKDTGTDSRALDGAGGTGNDSGEIPSDAPYVEPVGGSCISLALAPIGSPTPSSVASTLGITATPSGGALVSGHYVLTGAAYADASDCGEVSGNVAELDVIASTTTTGWLVESTQGSLQNMVGTTEVFTYSSSGTTLTVMPQCEAKVLGCPGSDSGSTCYDGGGAAILDDAGSYTVGFMDIPDAGRLAYAWQFTATDNQVQTFVPVGTTCVALSVWTK